MEVKLMVTSSSSSSPTSEYRAICLWKMDTGQADICNMYPIVYLTCCCNHYNVMSIKVPRGTLSWLWTE